VGAVPVAHHYYHHNPRTDFAAIESELDFIKSQFAPLPMRTDLARLALICLIGGASG
jgi:hypothetical protein